MTGTMRWAETLPDVVCDDMGDDVGLEPDTDEAFPCGAEMVGKFETTCYNPWGILCVVHAFLRGHVLVKSTVNGAFAVYPVAQCTGYEIQKPINLLD